MAPQFSLPGSRKSPAGSNLVGLLPLVGISALLGVGARNAAQLADRYALSADEFLRREGVPKPQALVAQLQAHGIRTYFDMHVAHLRRNHEWLRNLPAPNRTPVLSHLHRSSRYLLGTLAAPAAGFLFLCRDMLVDLTAALFTPVLEAAAAVVQHPWNNQDLLELLTLASSLALLWKVSSGYLLQRRSFRIECPRVTFDDVIGLRAAKEQVQMYVRFLQSPEAFLRLGARMPKGCLLAGPPGIGKTYLAKAVAGEAGVPFFAASGSDFMELFVGQGARSVRELFQAARKAAPSVVFIDELDAVGGHRSTLDSSGEHTRTINQLLAEMDGMAVTDVVVFAATNRIEHLDCALLRPGRFDKVVHMDIPTQADRRQLFEYYLRELAVVDPESDWGAQHTTLCDAEAATRRGLAAALSAATPEMTPAHISCICNEAALLAATADSAFVRPEHFERAIKEALHGVREAASPGAPLRNQRRNVPLD